MKTHRNLGDTLKFPQHRFQSFKELFPRYMLGHYA